MLIVSPRTKVSLKEAKAIEVDFFVTNCELSGDGRGYGVRLYVNGTAQAKTCYEWNPISLDVTEDAETLDLKLVLVRPSGKEIKTPAYNVATLTVAVEH